MLRKYLGVENITICDIIIGLCRGKTSSFTGGEWYEKSFFDAGASRRETNISIS